MWGTIKDWFAEVFGGDEDVAVEELKTVIKEQDEITSSLGRFDWAVEEILKWEGGYVDHPQDPGGATNMGITRNTLADWRGRPVSKEEVKELSESEAKDIYFKRYWRTGCC